MAKNPPPTSGGGLSQERPKRDQFAQKCSKREHLMRSEVGNHTAYVILVLTRCEINLLALHGLAHLFFLLTKEPRLEGCFRLWLDCNVGAPRGIAHCTLRKSRRSTHKLEQRTWVLKHLLVVAPKPRIK